MQTIKFYTDKTLKKIRFCINKTPKRIRFYVEKFVLAVQVAIWHVDTTVTKIITHLRITTRIKNKTEDNAFLSLSLYLALKGFIDCGVDNSTVVNACLHQWASLNGHEYTGILTHPTLGLYTSASHSDINHIIAKASSVQLCILSDINPLSLSDINNRTLNEIYYKEVL